MLAMPMLADATPSVTSWPDAFMGVAVLAFFAFMLWLLFRGGDHD